MRELHGALVRAVSLEANDAAEIQPLGGHFSYRPQSAGQGVMRVQVLARGQQALGVTRAEVVRGRLEQQVPGQKIIVKGIIPRMRVA